MAFIFIFFDLFGQLSKDNPIKPLYEAYFHWGPFCFTCPELTEQDPGT